MLRLAMMALANADLVHRVQYRMGQYGRAAGLAVGAFFLALLALAFLVQTLVAWLTLHVGPIWAPLIAAGALLALCLVLVLVAYLTIHSKPRAEAKASRLPAQALAALPDLAPVLRNRLPEIVAAAVVTGLLLGRRAKRR